MDLPMQDESIRTPVEDAESIDKTVLMLLLADDGRPLWSVEEVEREIGPRLAMAGSLERLRAAGLIHRCGEFVFATRAAILADRLAL
jgi:hypothetical protein